MDHVTTPPSEMATRWGKIKKAEVSCEKEVRARSRRISFRGRSWIYRRRCEKVLRVHSRKFLEKKSQTLLRWICELGNCNVRVRARNQRSQPNLRNMCEMELREQVRRKQRIKSQCKLNIICETRLRGQHRRFQKRSRSPFWRRFATTSCEKRTSRNFNCKMWLWVHTSRSPLHTSQDKIFWENI